jgi:hypothetical protein
MKLSLGTTEQGKFYMGWVTSSMTWDALTRVSIFIAVVSSNIRKHLGSGTSVQVTFATDLQVTTYGRERTRKPSKQKLEEIKRDKC